MCDTPALRNVVRKQFREFLRSLPCNGVPPSAEGNKKLIILIKGKIPVHHGTESHRCKPGQLHAVFCFHIFHQIPVAALKSAPHIPDIISPDVILVFILPLIAARSDRRLICIDKHSLDPGGSQLDPEYGLTCCDCFPNLFFSAHSPLLLILLLKQINLL